MQTNSLSSLGMEDNIWNLYRTDDPYLHEKKHEIPGMIRLCYETTHNGRTVTLGVYEYNKVGVLKAWGYKDDEHCSYHAIKTHGTWSDVIEGCPDFKLRDRGFSISHKKQHIWEENSYREEELSVSDALVCEVEDKVSYTPLIGIALFSLAIGIAITSFQMLTIEIFLMNSMGVFITILGLLKLRNVVTFAQVFRQYDPLAKKFPQYAKVYPYLETGVGLLILFNYFILPVQTAIVVVYALTTIGIISSLNRGKRLECGCLGGEIKLPLSKVTIVENVIMIMMALYTLVTFIK